MNKRTLAAGVVALALVLAGCGGSSNNAPSLSAFKTGFQSNKTSFRQLGIDLQKAITGAQSKTDAQLATELGALATRASSQAGSLAKLNPPAKYKTYLNSLAAGFRSVAADLRKIATAADKHDATTARAATVSLLSDAAKVKTADDAISKGLGIPTG